MAERPDSLGVPPPPRPHALTSVLDPAHLRDEIIRRWDAFSDTAVKTSAGTLAVTVTFRSSVAGHEPQASWLLILAWCALALVPIAAAALQVVLAAGNQLLLTYQLFDVPLPDIEERRFSRFVNRVGAVSAFVSITMVISFVVGMASFVTFACLNL